MIELIQHKIPDSSLVSSFNKLDEITLSLNVELINKDISRLKEMLKNSSNKYDKANIKALISYLKNIKKFTEEDGTYEMCWDIKEILPSTYPIQFIKESLYGINTTNYVELSENEKILEVDLHAMADIIAFEFMYRELDQDHDSIEELLNDCGVIGYESSNLMTNFFEDEGIKPFEFSKTFKISDTPYYSYEDKAVIDYFHSTKFNDVTYRNVIDYSCRYASTAIANAIMKNAVKCGIQAKAIMISPTNITLIISVDNNVNIKDKIIDSISIRTFGRNFVIEPSVQMF